MYDPVQMLEVVNSYYQCWANRDREGARALLADDLVFRSQWDRFEDADSFLDECWALRADAVSAQVFESVIEGDKGFFATEWLVSDGTSFGDASFIEVRDGKIVRIVVLSAGTNVTTQLA
jgi:ketosteroid isomerase-like protein